MRFPFSYFSTWVFLAAVLPAAATPTVTTLTMTQRGAPVTSIPSGSVVTLTASVAAGSAPVPSGTVNFCDATAASCIGVHSAGTAQLTGAGVAAVRFVPAAGTHSYKAVFVGTKTAEASVSSAASLTVTGAVPTTTSLVHTGTASDSTLTATVGGTAGTPPTGTVSFLDSNHGDAVLGTVALDAGSAGLIFLNASNPGTGSAPSVLAAGDFNNDGIPDLAAPTAGDGPDGPMQILLGKGDGTFSPIAQQLYGGYGGIAIAHGDFNGDGNEDLMTADPYTFQIPIMLGKGDGTFIPVQFLGANPTTNIVIADFDGDGNLDMAVGQGPITIYLGQGDGTFHSPNNPIAVDRSFLATALATGDFNGDGKTDLAVALGKDGSTPGKVEILLGNGDGTFTAAATRPATGTYPESLTAGDFNDDGIPDLAAGNDESPGTVTVLLGNGDGTFAPGTTLTTQGNGPGIAGLGDFNGDGIEDLLVENTGDERLTVFPGKGDGTFPHAIAGPVAGFNSASFAIADFNGDGNSDAAVLNPGAVAVTVLQPATQTAAATLTGIALPVVPEGHLVVASYTGDSNNQQGSSKPVSLAASSGVSLLPAALTFAATTVGSTAPYQQVTLTNTGTAQLFLSSIGVTNSTDPYSWGVRSSTCGAGLAPGDSCTFFVAFRPTRPGAITAAVTVGDSYGTFVQKVMLSGTGTGDNLPQVQLSPAGIQFPNTAVGTTAPYQPVTLANIGSGILNISSIQVTNTTDFYSWGIRDQGCGPTLAAGASCVFYVAFRPTRKGILTADITVNDNVGSSQQRVTLTGIGK